MRILRPYRILLKICKRLWQVGCTINSIVKKDNFVWNEEATAAACKLKAAMIQVPTLALTDFESLFLVEVDASGVGLGVVLCQKGRPLAFFSKALMGQTYFKSVYEWKLMAIVLVIQKWRHYLLGCILL